MPTKAITRTAPRKAISKPKPSTVASVETESTRALTGVVLQACLVAKDAAFNLRDFIKNSSNMAYLAVKDCEKELDRMERRVDEEITTAITEVSESEARQLLACLKFIIDLERIGDLTWSVTKRLHRLEDALTREDARDLMSMAEALEAMLSTVHDGFGRHNLDAATAVMQSDTRMDELCRSIFNRHLDSSDRHSGDRRGREYSVNLLFMAQAFERAGDHTKNLGEELFHLVEGRSLRHIKSKSRSAE
jgi:phosphate transport system protein